MTMATFCFKYNTWKQLWFWYWPNTLNVALVHKVAWDVFPMFYSLFLKKNHYQVAYLLKQTAVWLSAIVWQKVRDSESKSAKKQDGLSAKELEGKEGNSRNIWKGNELSSKAARRNKLKALHVLTASSYHCVCLSLSGYAPSFHHLCLPPPLLSCQQNCYWNAEFPFMPTQIPTSSFVSLFRPQSCSC